MQIPLVFRHALVAGGLVVLATVSACSDRGPTVPGDGITRDASAPHALLASTDVIVPGADAGAFTNAIVPNNSGWTTTEFWDNPSNDGANCNVGFYAVGSMGNCGSEAAGSDANQGGFTKYWGNGPEDRKTSSFMFDGSRAYRVTFLASYALEESEIGWFTVSGGVYTFHKLWDTKAINAVAIIPPTGGGTWGIYLRHVGHASTGTCAVNTDCSDALGDMHSGTSPAQQFALFTNADESRYMVGIEDNDEAFVNVGDDDFQDFIISVEPLELPMFVIGDVEDHAVGDIVNFWGAQWWKNNTMSGLVSNGVAAFKGFTSTAGSYCGGTWQTRPGNSPNPPATIGEDIAVIVTSTVLKDGSAISGDIREILIVHQDGGYGPNPGHAGMGEVLRVVCSGTNGAID